MEEKDVFKNVLAISIAIILIIGCGGGGGGTRVMTPPATMPEPQPPAVAPTHTSTNLPAPWFDLIAYNHIGTSQGVPENLSFAGTKNGARIYEGRVVDGEQPTDVIAYLRQAISLEGHLTTFPNPPTVRVVSGASDEFVIDTLNAVRIVNSILPYDRQLVFDTSSYAQVPNTAADVPRGNIYVQFLPQNMWPQALRSRPHETLGVAEQYKNLQTNAGHSARILIDTGENLPGRKSEYVIVHELIHSLGFLGHVEERRFPNSILNAVYIDDLIPLLLPEIDKDAVLAAYTRFRPGTPARDIAVQNLGPWESSSSQMIGVIDDIVFGVSHRNEMTYPFAYGAKSSGVPNESATWIGALVGFTSTGAKIDGNTRLDVRLADLIGDLRFSGIAYRTGATWGDGDLEYSVHIGAGGFNNFGRESRDVGDVSGRFFGANHEAMGGVLRRHDLTGAFGGKR